MPVKWNRWRFVLAFCMVWLPLMLFQPADQCDDCDNGNGQVQTQCKGTVYVQKATVTRVVPAPDTTYAVHQTQSWVPPWAIDVTNGGSAEVYVRSPSDSPLVTFRVYDLGGLQYERQNGTWDATMNSGGFHIVKDGTSSACKIAKTALGVSITETSTEYLVVVRPEVDEVQISVVRGSVLLTARDGEVLELDAENAPSMLIQDGRFVVESFFLPDSPDRILEYLENGWDLFGVPQLDPLPAIERPEQGWLVPRGQMPFDYPPGGYLEQALAGQYEGTTVVVDGPFTDVDEVLFNESMQAFEEATGIEVNYIGNKEFEGSISIRVEAGDAPDIADFPQPGLLAGFVRQGYIVDPTTFISEDWLSGQYNDSWLQMSTMGGQSAGVWHRFNGKSLVWYPKDDFDAAGYGIPTNWDELVALMDTMVADGDTPWCIGIESGAATGWPATDWMEEFMLRTTSLENYDAWTRGELPFSSSEVRYAAKMVAQIWFNDDYVYGGRDGIVSTFFGDSPAPMFEEPPQCWMHKQGNFITGFFPEGAQAGVDYDFFYLPGIDPAFGRPFLVAGDIMAMFNDRPEVRALMEYFTTPQSAEGWLQNGGALAAHRTATPEMYGQDMERGIAELVQQATSFRFDGSDLMPGEVGAGSFWKGMTDWVSGAADLDTVLAEIDESWPWE